MTSNKTFTIIKPDSVEKNNIGSILEKINASGFKISAMKLIKMSMSDAEGFYEVHKGKPFFEKLVNFMTSGPVVVAILEKENAVEDFRALIGATNPEEAAEGTLRKLFATSVTINAVHGSDSNENAAIEAAFFFSKRELF